MKKTPDHGFSRGEIAAIVLGLAIPVTLFALLLIPGAMASVVGFLTQRHIAPWAFGGAAAVVTAILIARIVGRIRRARGKRKPDAVENADSVRSLFRAPWK